jgi:hypothetical protein
VGGCHPAAVGLVSVLRNLAGDFDIALRKDQEEHVPGAAQVLADQTVAIGGKHGLTPDLQPHIAAFASAG